ncbi:hypothetical protein Q7P37_006044 [Cladosporium fusiforme]
MSTQTPNQAAPSTGKGKSKGKSKATPPSSSSTWRCAGIERLHRDDHACTNTPPSSPIIDTPSKRMRLERKMAGLASQPQSQGTTQPTPSRPQTRPQTILPAVPESEAASPSASSSNISNLDLLDSSPNVPGPANLNLSNPQSRITSIPALGDLTLNDIAVPSSPEGFDAPQLPTGPGSDSERIPETPPNPSNLPALPHLTEDNLMALNSNSSISPSSENPDDKNTIIHTQAPRTPSLASTTAAQIRRLVLRTKINGLHHQASEEKLSLTSQNLQTATSIIQQESARRRAWKAISILLMFLVFFYAAWCWYNSAEFVYIRQRAREHFGLRLLPTS